jgi:hypothetical protein
VVIFNSFFLSLSEAIWEDQNGDLHGDALFRGIPYDMSTKNMGNHSNKMVIQATSTGIYINKHKISDFNKKMGSSQATQTT